MYLTYSLYLLLLRPSFYLLIEGRALITPTILSITANRVKQLKYIRKTDDDAFMKGRVMETKLGKVNYCLSLNSSSLHIQKHDRLVKHDYHHYPLHKDKCRRYIQNTTKHAFKTDYKAKTN